ncbi:type II toxin-antitoxin system CcdA family antitoxin [Sphingomonas sp. 37zxx]|uniref:type II toxin-antitoxin system CcdA family antitoxin n=1 Tax=Sphingomonas sp. 37zxx TaxID=1550073 RepID=UPI00068AACE3|nr:type II toxin-antitoxin system CcdA family antitoxin [Sphingomonas sp. 37zxx]
MRTDRPRRATNVSLPADAVAEAKTLGLNVSQACEEGLLNRLKHARKEQWTKDNWEAIQANNAWVEEHGLPLAKYRMF